MNATAVMTLTNPIAATPTAFDLKWVILAAGLVVFMQAGFALVKIGLGRANRPNGNKRGLLRGDPFPAAARPITRVPAPSLK